MALSTAQLVESCSAIAKELPPLEADGHLTRAEFERRYAAMPDLKKAELIEGRGYMPSPVTTKHSGPQAGIVTWLGYYRAFTPVFLPGGNNGSIRFDGDSEPQPDALLKDDLARVLTGPQAGLASPEHENFLVRLQAKQARQQGELRG